MVGNAIESVQAGMQMMITELRKNPYALEMGAVCVITFGKGATKLVPLTEVYAFQMPTLSVAPGTALGEGLKMLDQSLSADLVRSTPEKKGDFKPLVFILTDGQPTDEWRSAARTLKEHHKSAVVYAIGCGDDVDMSVLRELTDSSFLMEQMDSAAFAKLFVCISSSVQSASGSIGMGGVQEGPQNLEKWGDDALVKVDSVEPPRKGQKRQVFIPGICQKHKLPYLMRYKADDGGNYVCVAAHKLPANFPAGEGVKGQTVSSEELNGIMPCPHCGNAGQGTCNCGCNTCFDVTRGETLNGQAAFKYTCPSCGTADYFVIGGPFDINQSAG